MKFFLDLFPIISFFIAYKMYDFMVATGVLIVATVFQVGGTWLLTKKIEKIQIITLVAVCFFGGLTLLFNNPDFLIWKFSIVFWGFASIIFVRKWMHKTSMQPLFSMLLGENTVSRIPSELWQHIDNVWAYFFLIMGGVNLYVAFQFSLDTWVMFETWGVPFIQVFVIIYTIFKFAPYFDVEEDSNSKQSEATKTSLDEPPSSPKQ
ncbi:MAG: inner membrane-spanning protein YciB [Pseudomonadota bacterium]